MRVLLFIFSFFLFLLSSPVLAQADTAAFTIFSTNYLINGQTKAMDVAPYIKNDRTYLPLRYAAFAVGISNENIIWNSVDKSVVLIKGDRVVKLIVGNTSMLINGTPINMDVSPEIINNRTMLPLRYIANAFGISVYWDGNTQTAFLGNKPDLEPLSLSKSSVITVQPLEYDEEETIKKDFTWNYNGKKYNWHVEVPVNLTNYNREVHDYVSDFYNSDGVTQYQLLSSVSDQMKSLIFSYSADAYGNFVPWVTEEYNYEFTGFMAERLAIQAKNDGYDYFHTAEFVLSFVGGSIPYKIATYQLPAQTLIDNGDCDCKSILLASILNNLGYDIALLKYPTHMAVGIAFSDENLPKGGGFSYYNHNGTKYYFAETTTSGWQIGKMSDEKNEKSAYVYPVN